MSIILAWKSLNKVLSVMGHQAKSLFAGVSIQRGLFSDVNDIAVVKHIPSCSPAGIPQCSTVNNPFTRICFKNATWNADWNTKNKKGLSTSYLGTYRIIREHGGPLVDCLTWDQGAAGSSLTGKTKLCPWAWHIYPCQVLVQYRKTSPDITEKLLTGTFLFDLVLYVHSTIFSVMRDVSSWVEPVLS